jgi:CheY-like chemotaxis protein
LSFVAHELRASINTILGWAELFRVREFDEASRVRAAETIIRHAKHQAWLVNEIVETWRLKAGTLALSPAAVNLRSVMEGAVEAVRPMASARGIAIEVQGPHTAPAVRADAQRLKLVLVSMLLNTMHVVASGGRLALRLVPRDADLDVELRDLGLAGDPDTPSTVPEVPGADMAKAARRLDLGLGLVRGLVDLHGGSVRMEAGHGLTVPLFTLTLPIDGAPAPRRAAPAMPLRLAGLHVLIVDDEPDARRALAGILSHHGAVVVEAASAAEALAAIGNEPVDVLLADISMPGEDGYDLIRRVRRLSSSAAALPAAAVTARTGDTDRQRALQAGFQVHLPKPIDPQMLVSTVATLRGRPASAP